MTFFEKPASNDKQVRQHYRQTGIDDPYSANLLTRYPLSEEMDIQLLDLYFA